MNDVRRCKFCREMSAEPFCRLQGATLYTCRRCDFHFLDRLDPPDVSEEGSGEATLGSAGRAYIEKRLAGNERLLRGRLELVRSHAVLKGSRCLDVGAGVGQFLLLLQEEGGDAEGIEPSALRREFARERFGLQLERRTIEYGRWREHAESFDLATLWDVIEHVNDPAATLAGVCRALRPGGLVFVETPSRDSLWYRLGAWACRRSSGRLPLFLDALYQAAPYGHKQIFRPGQLRQMAENCGFEVQVLAYSHAAARGSRPEEGLRPSPFPFPCRPRNQIILVARKPL